MLYFNKRLCAGALMLALTCLVMSASSVLALEDAIIAQVDDELITLKDLRDYVTAVYARLSTEGMSKDKLQEIMKELEINGINKLIEDRLILSAAKNIGIEINEKLIDTRLVEIKSRYATEEAFIQSLIENGSNLTELRKTIEEQFKIQFTIENEVKSKIFVNPAEVNAYYKQNLDSFQRKERVYLESIYITDKGDHLATMAKAVTAFELIKRGRGFLDVAKEYSDTPSIGVIERGQILPEIEDQVFDMQENEISEPIEVDGGVYIFQMKGRTPAQVASLDAVKNEIRERIYYNKYKARFESWIDELKKDAYVEIK